MAGLKQTTAKLARYRRQLDAMLAAAARGPSPAAQGDSGRGGATEITDFGSNPGNLRMFAHIPDSCAAGAPLVVVLHGCTQNARGYDAGAGWSTLAERYGFALLLPEQRRENNPNNCFNWFLPGDTTRGGGEVLSIQHMIEHLAEAYDLDRNRVFVTGLSAGGAMAAAMLATYPETFAGGAVLAGLPYGIAGNVQEALDGMFRGKSLAPRQWGDLVRSASAHQGPWPKLSVWHGTADTTVLPGNAEELIKQWTDLHGLPLDPTRHEIVDGYPRRVWQDQSGEVLVEAYSLTGMAHGTPIAAGTGEPGATCGSAAPFILEAGISSSYRIAAFWDLVGKREPARIAPRNRQQSVPARPASKAGDGQAVRLRPPAPAAPSGDTEMPRRKGPATDSLLDPAAVINKALRKAGLLKR